jgi:MFS family permease
MKRWVVIVAVLYSLTLLVLALPTALLAFIPDSKFSAKDIADFFGSWQLWLLAVVMGLAQAALLAVPVQFASRRPNTRRPLALSVAAGALMMGGLVFGAIICLEEFFYRDKGPDWIGWAALGLGVTVWGAWAVIFFRMGRNSEPQDFVSRQCRLLLKGSILELLIAVPTHIVARCRDYCCAGFMTFVGLSLGISVMLFSFGPGVFFLFVARWRRLHPAEQMT